MFQHDYGGRPIDSHCPLKANCSQVAWQVHSLRNSRRGSHHAAAGTEIFDRSIRIESNTSLSRGGVARTSAPHWHSGGSEYCISGGGTPNRCRETDSHVIPQASFFQGIGVIRGALMAAHSPTGLSFFLLLFSFFEPIASFPQRNFTPGSPRNDDRQLGRPTASRFCPCTCVSPFPEVDRAIPALPLVTVRVQKTLLANDPIRDQISLSRVAVELD